MTAKPYTDLLLPLGYRSISFLSNLSIITEDITLARLGDTVGGAYLLSDEQLGFRQSLLDGFQLFWVREEMRNALKFWHSANMH